MVKQSRKKYPTNFKNQKNFPKNCQPLTEVRGLIDNFSLTGKFFGCSKIDNSIFNSSIINYGVIDFAHIKTSLCRGLLGLIIGGLGGFCVDSLIYEYQLNKVIKSAKAPVPLSDPEVQKFLEEYSHHKKCFLYAEMGSLAGLILGAYREGGGRTVDEHMLSRKFGRRGKIILYSRVDNLKNLIACFFSSQ